MRVESIMFRDVVCCRRTDSLAEAAQAMWNHDIGCVPVIDDQGHVVGIVTDRDVAMAAYTRGQPLAAVPVTIAMASHVITCAPGDDVGAVEKTMAARQVRRVPVVDESGHPVGMVSLNDLARAAVRTLSIPAPEVASTLAAICAPRAPVVPAA
jgi:CBS domain-containing protein